jgi:dipeptidyl aminopeptidase/acylaminoacyl peptidase
MLTFLRGPGTFQSQGQVYAKLLPGGEAVPLTSDTLTKMGPVFSPDGTRVAYTVNDIGEPWSTWVVPTLRGKPSRWLHNASGLTWSGVGQLLFSEIKPGSVQHMGIVTSTEARSTTRAVYFPGHQSGMAHRSALSPDGTSVLLTEMDERGVWMPCRLVPIDGGSPGQTVGPAGAPCTQAAWAPGGRWMYFSADAGDGFHLWRQREPGSQPEQITFGPSMQEGLAIAPDGGSLITSVGFRQRGVWLHDASGERQISGEDYSFWPLFSSDGKTICYRRAPAPVTGTAATELWMTELDSVRTERLLPGQLITQYDLSRDDRIVASVLDPDGKSRLWLAWLDGHEPPRPIPGVEGISPRFGSGGEIWFRATEGSASFLFVINEDGTGLRKVSGDVGAVMGMSSPDGEWVSSPASQSGGLVMTAFSSKGRPPVPIGPGVSVSRLRWSPDGQKAYLAIQIGGASAFGTGRTYILPLAKGSMLPQIPSGGFRSEAELAAVPGVEILPYGDVALSPTAGVYAYSRETITRNLYRIPLNP